MIRESSIVLINKDSGPSSFDVVRMIKESLGNALKVGHGGSLDPFATGLLVVLIGRATKLSSSFLNADKSYEAEVKLGVATDTMDLTGRTTQEAPVPTLSECYLTNIIKSFSGNWNQIPPPFSAKKVHGVRLYELARKEILIKRSPTTVKIYSIDLKYFRPPIIGISLYCSKGTYVRSLADEIGRKLGTYAHLYALKRTTCGIFSLEEAIKLDDFIANPYFHLEKGYINYTKLFQYEYKKTDCLQKLSFTDSFFST